jgi:hypothetical protein
MADTAVIVSAVLEPEKDRATQDSNWQQRVSGSQNDFTTFSPFRVSPTSGRRRVRPPPFHRAHKEGARSASSHLGGGLMVFDLN